MKRFENQHFSFMLQPYYIGPSIQHSVVQDPYFFIPNLERFQLLLSVYIIFLLDTFTNKRN